MKQTTKPFTPTETYRSFLIRCWSTRAVKPGQAPRQRFVVETVTNTPNRWGFDTLAELVAFLQTELVAGGNRLAGGAVAEDTP